MSTTAQTTTSYEPDTIADPATVYSYELSSSSHHLRMNPYAICSLNPSSLTLIMYALLIITYLNISISNTIKMVISEQPTDDTNNYGTIANTKYLNYANELESPASPSSVILSLSSISEIILLLSEDINIDNYEIHTILNQSDYEYLIMSNQNVLNYEIFKLKNK